MNNAASVLSDHLQRPFWQVGGSVAIAMHENVPGFMSHFLPATQEA